MRSKKWDLPVSIVSWLVALGLVFAASSIWFAPPTGLGPIGGLLGVLGAQIFYTVLYLGEAIILAIAKWFKMNRLRKHTLLVIYLTGFFTTLVTMLVVGWTPKFVDNLLLAGAAAWCWLYWKMRTEYVDIEALNEEQVA